MEEITFNYNGLKSTKLSEQNKIRWIVQFEDNKSMSFIAGVYHNENEFSFAKENKIGLFSKKPKSITEKDLENIGLFWEGPQTMEVVPEVSYEGEAGSVKFTYTQEQGWNYFILKTPLVTDISLYDYIEFSIYNNQKYKYYFFHFIASCMFFSFS